MKFESVSGQASIYVEQDFLAQIHVYNMMEDMIEFVEDELLNSDEKKSKYHQHLNETPRKRHAEISASQTIINFSKKNIQESK